MIVSIHQPQYLPWLGYFDKVDKADVFCFLDDVQFKKNDFQNRNRIKTANGWQWITVPVKYRHPQRINEVELNHSVNWQRKHLQALVTNYRKAPFFDETIELFSDMYERRWENIAEVNLAFLERLLTLLGMTGKKTVLASHLDVSREPTDRLIDICKALGGDTYLAGAGGANYMNMERFRERGVKVIFQNFNHPEYPQLFGEFLEQMSVVDLLFNCGPKSIEIIRSANPFVRS